MPLTPKFSITQTDEFIIVEINVPYVRVGDMEFVVDDCDFSFFCNPYLLKLHFPYPCIDDERAKAVYDVDKDNGTVYVHIPKVEKGRFFPDLDLISTLLQKPTPMPTLPRGPLIQELDAPAAPVSAPLETPSTNTDLLSLEENAASRPRKYGFNDLFENVFKSFEDCSEIIENPVPDDSQSDPYELMRAMETTKFSKDHYLSDYVYGKEDYLYAEFTQFLPPWVLADRILRKRVKEEGNPPVVPPSDFYDFYDFYDFGKSGSNGEPQQATENREKKEEHKSHSGDETPIQVKPLISETPSSRGKSLITEIDETPCQKSGEFLESESRAAEQIVETKREFLDVTPHIPSMILTIDPPNPTSTSTVSTVSTVSTSTSTSPEAAKARAVAEQIRQHVGSHRFSHEEMCELTKEENDLIGSIRPISFSIPKDRRGHILFSLVDILCAYCYDVRMTQNDPNTESAWTISILSPTLSWLNQLSSLHTVLVSFIRRVLIYPYLRRYDLARLCIRDCALIIKLGKRRILKCLLDIKKVFKYSERKYILNTLYIDKYILWIQSVDYPVLYDLSEEISYLLKTRINREVLDLGIPELDSEAKEILKEELESQQ